MASPTSIPEIAIDRHAAAKYPRCMALPLSEQSQYLLSDRSAAGGTVACFEFAERRHVPSAALRRIYANSVAARKGAASSSCIRHARSLSLETIVSFDRCRRNGANSLNKLRKDYPPVGEKRYLYSCSLYRTQRCSSARGVVPDFWLAPVTCQSSASQSAGISLPRQATC